MAGDNSSPKVRMLLTIGIVSVCILVAVKFGLESYYLETTEAYQRTLLPNTTEIETVRKSELQRLEKGTMPVDVAMQTLATKGRENASPAIDPQPSDDPSPLIGWAQIKRPGPVPELAPVPTAADAGATLTTPGDAGAPLTAGDAGAPHAATTKDGGAPVHRPPPAATDGGH